MIISQKELRLFREAITPTNITLSPTTDVDMTFNRQKFNENGELNYQIAKALVDFIELEGGNDLSTYYTEIENQPEKVLRFIFTNSTLFENIAKRYHAAMPIMNLQGGETLTRTADGSKWRFLHYKPINAGGSTVEDKNLVHVEKWDYAASNWSEGDHEEFSTSEFEKA